MLLLLLLCCCCCVVAAAVLLLLLYCCCCCCCCAAATAAGTPCLDLGPSILNLKPWSMNLKWLKMNFWVRPGCCKYDFAKNIFSLLGGLWVQWCLGHSWPQEVTLKGQGSGTNPKPWQLEHCRLQAQAWSPNSRPSPKPQTKIPKKFEGKAPKSATKTLENLDKN